MAPSWAARFDQPSTTFTDVNMSPSTPLDFLERHRGVLALLVAAAAVRLADLSAWWLNPDEGIYYSILTRADFDGFWHEVAANAHPPFYYLLLRGVGVLTNDFLWFRLLSVIAGLAAVAAAWAVARRLAEGGTRGTVAGFLAALLLAFAPGAVELSQVMRPYMLQLALLSWALFFFLRWGRTTASPDLVAYLVLLCLALLTHYGTALALGVFVIATVADGRARGFATPEWRRLAAAHMVPFGVVAALYVLHLRPLAASAIADEALDGWLSYYMIDAPTDVWWSFLGFQHLVAHPWLRGPAAVFLLAAVALSLYAAERRVALFAGGSLLLAIAVAAAGLYPFGATRHSVWALAFTVPALGWVGAFLLDGPPGGRPGLRIVVPLIVIALGGPVGSALGNSRAPWAPTDRVLRQDDLARLVDALDPASGPELLVMSAQTYYLLLPFYPDERERAVFSADSSAFHFPYGRRRVLVSQAWDFSARASGSTEATPGDFADFLRLADREFPELDVAGRADLGLVVGGWRPTFVDEIRRLGERGSFIRSWRNVPGLYTFELDGGRLAATLGLR